MTLRFVIRDGEKILQYCEYQETYDHVPFGDGKIMALVPTGGTYVWKDIPLCDEFTGQEIKE